MATCTHATNCMTLLEQNEKKNESETIPNCEQLFCVATLLMLTIFFF